MPSLAIDFGTSNCTAFVAHRDQLLPVALDGEDFVLPSAVFSLRREADRASRDQSFFSMLKGGQAGGQAMLFGTPALDAYIADPLSGVLVRSPKSFLGSDIAPEHLKSFQDVVTAMLRHIRTRAEAACGEALTRVLLGRPVRYHGVRGDDGNAQALEVMQRAAAAAGFTDIRFEFEPMAAAYEYERTITEEQVVLVVDVGGGTTDIVMLRASPERSGRPDRNEDILGVAGDRIGGTDFDELLAWNAFMESFGKDSMTLNGKHVPNPLLYDAISIRNVPAQMRFGSPAARREIDRLLRESASPEKLERFSILHEFQLQHRLVHSAELGKIALSRDDTCTVSLDYVEADLGIPIRREQLTEATARLVQQIRALATETIRSAGTPPDVIFMTGGTAISPNVIAAVADVAGPGVPMRSGDMLGTVGRGLGLRAQRIFANQGAS